MGPCGIELATRVQVGVSLTLSLVADDDETGCCGGGEHVGVGDVVGDGGVGCVADGRDDRYRVAVLVGVGGWVSFGVVGWFGRWCWR